MTTLFPKQADAPSHFGRIEIRDGQPTERWERANLTTINLPYRMRLARDLSQTTLKLRCHRNIARGLSQILSEILDLYGSPAEIQKAKMDLLGDCYAFSLSNPSMHDYGAALDLNPNAKKDGIPPEVIEIFEAHGWAFKDGHFQATR